jgi:hypothetical protein
VAIDGPHLPLGILEHHFFALLLLWIHLLFALPLTGRRAFLEWLLLLLAKLLCELLDLLALSYAVACGVVHWALHATIITIGCLMGALVTLWASAPTNRYSSSSGGAG